MEIRNNAEALKAFLGVSSSQPTKNPAVRAPEAEGAQGAFAGDQISVSGLGAAVQSAAGDDGPRLEKVEAIQRALAAGTYSIPAAKVADKMIDSMLNASLETKG